MPCSSVGGSCPLPAPPVKCHCQVLWAKRNPWRSSPQLQFSDRPHNAATTPSRWADAEVGQIWANCANLCQHRRYDQNKGVRMRNSCFQVRWYFKRHSQHVSCCLLSHFTPCCQTLSFIPRKQMEKGKLFPACSHPGSHQGPPTHHGGSETHCQSCKGPVSPHAENNLFLTGSAPHI